MGGEAGACSTATTVRGASNWPQREEERPPPTRLWEFPPGVRGVHTVCGGGHHSHRGSRYQYAPAEVCPGAVAQRDGIGVAVEKGVLAAHNADGDLLQQLALACSCERDAEQQEAHMEREQGRSLLRHGGVDQLLTVGRSDRMFSSLPCKFRMKVRLVGAGKAALRSSAQHVRPRRGATPNSADSSCYLPL